MNENPVTVPSKKERKVWKLGVVSCFDCGDGLGALPGMGFYAKAIWGSAHGSGRGSCSDLPCRLVRISPIPFVRLEIFAPLMQVDLYPKVSGYLEQMSVNLGDSVRQGQVIAQIDRTDFLQKVKEVEAKVAQAKANLAEIEAGTRTEEVRQAEEAVKQAQSRFENARLQRERMEALFKRQIISKKDFDNAETEYTVAEAQLEANQQRLKMLREGARQEVKEAAQGKLKEMESLLAQEQTRLQNAMIIAPFSGEIIRRHVDAGALVSSSTPLVTLVHTETLKVVANVLEKDIPFLKPGMRAKIQAEAYPDKDF